MRIAILQLYCGQSGKSGFYNNQLLGLAKAYAKMGHKIFVVFPLGCVHYVNPSVNLQNFSKRNWLAEIKLSQCTNLICCFVCFLPEWLQFGAGHAVTDHTIC